MKGWTLADDWLEDFSDFAIEERLNSCYAPRILLRTLKRILYVLFPVLTVESDPISIEGPDQRDGFYTVHLSGYMLVTSVKWRLNLDAICILIHFSNIKLSVGCLQLLENFRSNPYLSLRLSCILIVQKKNFSSLYYNKNYWVQTATLRIQGVLCELTIHRDLIEKLDFVTYQSIIFLFRFLLLRGASWSKAQILFSEFSRRRFHLFHCRHWWFTVHNQQNSIQRRIISGFRFSPL